MEAILSNIITRLDYFVLVFIRITAILVSSPIFGRKSIPNIAKIGLCLCLTYIVFLVSPMPEPLLVRGMLEYAMYCAKELLFGVVLGYCTQVFFSLVQTAGYAIDMQMGFGMVNVFDVQNNVSVPVTGNFLYIVLTVMFFAVNAHHQLLYILLSTFESVPVGQAALNSSVALTALKVFVLSFVMALNVAIPFIASGLLGEIILGFIVRTTPQMNVFVVGIPLKILLGFLMLIVVLPIYVRYTPTIFAQMFSAMDNMLRGLAVT